MMRPSAPDAEHVAAVLAEQEIVIHVGPAIAHHRVNGEPAPKYMSREPSAL